MLTFDLYLDIMFAKVCKSLVAEMKRKIGAAPDFHASLKKKHKKMLTDGLVQ